MSIKMLAKTSYNEQGIQHIPPPGNPRPRSGRTVNWLGACYTNERTPAQVSNEVRETELYTKTNYRNKELSNNLKYHTCSDKHHKQLQKPEQRIFRDIVTKYYVCSAENDISKFSLDLPDSRMLGRRGLTAQIGCSLCFDYYYYANFPLN